MKALALLALLFPAAALAASPFDGDWVLAEARCDGVSTSIAPLVDVRFRFMDNHFQYVSTDETGCQIARQAQATYAPDHTVQLRAEATGCAPRACNATCTEPVDPAPETLAYTLSGELSDTLKFESIACDDTGICKKDQKETLILQPAQ